MKNADKWNVNRFERDAKGRIIGTHNHKIIGNAYEPIIKKYSTGKLLDVGCGDVPYYNFYKDCVDENICVDWGNSSLDISYLDFEADLNLGLPMIEDNTFDTVLCTDVLEHIYYPEILFTEMTRVLKTGGHLILTVPFLYWVHANPHDYHRYTHFKLEQFCQTNNLEKVELICYGGLPEIIYDLLVKGIAYYDLPGKGILLKILADIGTFLSKLGKVKRMSETSKSTFPMGYVLVAKK